MSRLTTLLVLVAACRTGTADDLKPFGQPTIRTGTPAAYYIWIDRDGTHLRATTARRSRVFSGKIVSNKPIAVARPVQLEGGTNRDFLVLSKDRRTLAFKLKTEAGIDGFDLRLQRPIAEGPIELEFDLKIDGASTPPNARIARRIFVGRDKTSPAKSQFEIRLSRSKPE